MNKLLLLAIVLLLIVPTINAQNVNSIGAFREEFQVELVQACSNDTSLCDLCNITSVRYPNTSIILSNEIMVRRDTTSDDFVFNLTSNHTGTRGLYMVNGFCQSGTEFEVWDYTFEITGTGFVLTTSQGILYVLLLLVTLIIFGLSMYGAIVLPWSNNHDEYGKVVGVNDLKFVKLFLCFWSYAMAASIMFIMWSITDGFLNFKMVGNLFRALFLTLAWLFIPIFILFILTALIRFLTDKQINEALRRNIPIR